MRASIRIAGVLWPALLGLCLVAPSAGAYVYWATPEASKIGRATNDGAVVEPSFIVLTSPKSPSAVTVDSHHIYWADYVGHSIGRASIDGTEVKPDFIKLAYAPTGLTIDDSHIYWAADTLIGRAALDGTEVKPEFIKKNVGFPCGLAVDAGHLYWPTGVSGPGYVERAPLNGSTVEYEWVKIPAVAALCGIAVNTANVFWGDNGLGGGTNIGRANIATGGGVDSSFIGAAHGPCGLTIFDSKLYWANSGTSTIARANTDSSSVEYEWLRTGAPVGSICGVALDSLTPPAPPPPGDTDTTPPQTKIVKGPGKRLSKGRARFSFASSESGSTFRCKLDRGKVAACRSPRRYAGLDSGRHLFKVWATDSAGNKDQTPAKRRFRVPG